MSTPSRSISRSSAWLAETEAQATRLAERAARTRGERFAGGIEDEFGDRLDQTLDGGRLRGRHEHGDGALVQRGGNRAHAVAAHRPEHLAEDADALETGATRATEMILDRAPFAGAEALLEEIERGTRVEVSVLIRGLRHCGLRICT
jgi:hypothetical protein